MQGFVFVSVVFGVVHGSSLRSGLRSGTTCDYAVRDMCEAFEFWNAKKCLRLCDDMNRKEDLEKSAKNKETYEHSLQGKVNDCDTSRKSSVEQGVAPYDCIMKGSKVLFKPLAANQICFKSTGEIPLLYELPVTNTQSGLQAAETKCQDICSVMNKNCLTSEFSGDNSTCCEYAGVGWVGVDGVDNNGILPICHIWTAFHMDMSKGMGAYSCVDATTAYFGNFHPGNTFESISNLGPKLAALAQKYSALDTKYVSSLDASVALDRMTDYGTCGDRIDWVVKNENSTAHDARLKVARDYPDLCGPVVFTDLKVTPGAPRVVYSGQWKFIDILGGTVHYKVNDQVGPCTLEKTNKQTQVYQQCVGTSKQDIQTLLIAINSDKSAVQSLAASMNANPCKACYKVVASVIDALEKEVGGLLNTIGCASVSIAIDILAIALDLLIEAVLTTSTDGTAVAWMAQPVCVESEAAKTTESFEKIVEKVGEENLKGFVKEFICTIVEDEIVGHGASKAIAELGIDEHPEPSVCEIIKMQEESYEFALHLYCLRFVEAVSIVLKPLIMKNIKIGDHTCAA